MTDRRLTPGSRIVVASHNKGKVAEFDALLKPFGLSAVSAGELGLPEPEETETTFEGNARLSGSLVDVTIDAELGKYVNGLADRGHFDAVQVAPASSAEVPDEAGGVRAVVLGVKYPHNGRDGSEALVE